MDETLKRRPFLYLDRVIRLEYVLYAFWAMFWLLNGADKFFNGRLLEGWFGVTRDAQFVEYFARLQLPEALALTSLYGFAVLEIMVGLLFLVVLLFPRTPRAVNRFAFKLSMMVFLVFSTGDILFGDRAELWEHGTFMILTLQTYHIYLDRPREHAEVVGPEHFDIADVDRDRTISSEEFDNFMDRLRRAAQIGAA